MKKNKNREIKTVYDGPRSRKRKIKRLSDIPDYIMEIPTKDLSIKDNIKMNLDEIGTKLKLIGTILKL